MQFMTPLQDLPQHGLYSRPAPPFKHEKQKVIYSTWNRKLPILTMGELAAVEEPIPNKNEVSIQQQPTTLEEVLSSPTLTGEVLRSLQNAYQAVTSAIFTPLKCEVPHYDDILTSEVLAESWEEGLRELGYWFMEWQFTPGEFESILRTLLKKVEMLEELRDGLEEHVNGEAVERVLKVLGARLGVLEREFVELGTVLEGFEGDGS